MERLFGNGENVEIWRPTAVERLEQFHAEWQRDYPQQNRLA
jgi:hypothetical protein